MCTSDLLLIATNYTKLLSIKDINSQNKSGEVNIIIADFLPTDRIVWCYSLPH